MKIRYKTTSISGRLIINCAYFNFTNKIEDQSCDQYQYPENQLVDNGAGR